MGQSTHHLGGGECRRPKLRPLSHVTPDPFANLTQSLPRDEPAPPGRYCGWDAAWTAHEYINFPLLLCGTHERTRFVEIVLPLLALWLPECPSVAQIRGQGTLSALCPWVPPLSDRGAETP